jgi:hypothetical protein
MQTLPQYTAADSVIAKYMYDDGFLGPFWEQPGRNIVRGLLDAIPWPEDAAWNADTRRRLKWTGKSGEDALIMKREVGWDDIEGGCYALSEHVMTGSHLPSHSVYRDVLIGALVPRGSSWRRSRHRKAFCGRVAGDSQDLSWR